MPDGTKTRTSMRVAVFASGGGTSLQALLDTCHSDEAVNIALLCSDRDSAGALRRASLAGVPTHVFSNFGDGQEVLAVLQDHHIDFIVLAGYLRLVPHSIVTAYHRHMINIHPALLPSFGGKGMYGQRVHRAVIDAGAKITGPTIHLVTAEYDQGEIVAQWPVPVHNNDTPETLAARVLEVEHQLLPAVVRLIAREGTTNLPLEFNMFQAADKIVIPDTINNS